MEKDIKDVGLSEHLVEKLREMTEENQLFSQMQDGYRLAVSLAISKNLNINNVNLTRRKNMYAVGAIDEDQVFKYIIRENYPNFANQEYRALEKLADLGITFLSENIKGKIIIDINEILNQ